ncbi:glycoside hydrolase family 18 protein [Microthyrium microscopicum]|uniref:chitinase n=1 Tax=Microthyrium microscopicum TaxID=703497 RepID=A0A6A6U1L3_9PEZI|nr:glycoside hydrolase family 18 protein [Microthyrium microscopicum]
MNPYWFKAGLGAVVLLSSIVSGQPGLRKPASPGYNGLNACPGRCSIAGPSPGNWSLYHNLEQTESCKQTQFCAFSIFDPVDKFDALHRIYSCSSYGPDWENLPNITNSRAATTINATYHLGTWPDGGLSTAHVRSLSRQMGDYLAGGYGSSTKPLIMFARSGTTSVGLYIGKGLQYEETGAFALQTLDGSLSSMSGTTGSVALQLCQAGNDGDHVFGLMTTSNPTFGPIQAAIQSWANAKCLDLNNSTEVNGPAHLTTPLILAPSNITNTTGLKFNLTSPQNLRRWSGRLERRDDCTAIQVVSGDGCYSLSQKCGITTDQFSQYNSDPNICSDIQPGQHVCCSSGSLPNYAPQPNGDGSCATYTVQSGDYCAGIAAANSITVDQLNDFNSKTWSWNGCSSLYAGIIICLSSGNPPMPAAVANALCGPTMPGTQTPAAGTDISTLNPCPLNACCDVWGQCGVTAEFCTDTNTGAPGTAQPGTNGCISNCGTDVVSSGPPAIYRTVAYYEGFGLSRPCLYQDAWQISSGYTNLHFGFGALTPDYQVDLGDSLSSFEFQRFKTMTGTKRVLSFGGWTFSTDPSTYTIFREGVTSTNRQAMATSIANFINENGLDGVDIDWEYPGAPDIPGIPPADPSDGDNYLQFLTLLKSLLPGKTVSIAAPSSYWYLKGYPIAKIAKIIDYIVYMTYDLHGQWDSTNSNSQEGCPGGNCLRSDVNLTETMTALAMITKAGVPSNQVIVGVTSYGRSFEMSDPGCSTEQCTYTGGQTQSNAAEGPCTGTAGYISNAEIQDIINNPSRVNSNYLDESSQTNILVYDGNQWVGWMADDVKNSRHNLYMGLNMGGTTDWATDLQAYNDPPSPASSWTEFISDVQSGIDPINKGTRTGNWTQVTCTDSAVVYQASMSPAQRWSQMDGSDAWNDVINQWTNVDSHTSLSFSESVANTLNLQENTNCGSETEFSNCDQTVECKTTTGPLGNVGAVAYELWNSLVMIHEMYATINNAILQTAATFEPSFPSFETTFAPVAPPKDNTWLQILLDFITLGVGAAVAPLFNSFIRDLPAFEGNPNGVDTAKDVTFALIAASLAAGKDAVADQKSGDWTLDDQNTFSAYLGQVINAWGNSTEQALATLFNGSGASIQILTALISNGSLITGSGGKSGIPFPPTYAQLDLYVAKAFFAYSVPKLWGAAGYHPFIIDSGYSCGTVDPLSRYMSTETMHATSSCVGTKLYYLVSPITNIDQNTCSNPVDGRCPEVPFTSPPGISTLTGDTSVWGGLTRDVIVAGAVNSYVSNGNANGGPIADPSVRTIFDGFLGGVESTAGMIRIPVCSPEEALTAYDDSSTQTQANWPCVVAASPNLCGTSTFVGATSDASPLTTDCQQIVTNIVGTQGVWEVEAAVHEQHQIVQAGTCAFGVQGSTGEGSVDFSVGAQDIVDLINSSVQQFASNGKVGAGGNMACNGNNGQVSVAWGLYHT